MQNVRFSLAVDWEGMHKHGGQVCTLVETVATKFLGETRKCGIIKSGIANIGHYL